jgi:hypothetical membrane protein
VPYCGDMRRVPWWAVGSSIAAPVFLIGGWTVAAALQPAGFDPLRDTISALAALGAADRVVMTVAFVGLGVSHLVTATGLLPAALVGRLVLALGGLATVLVAAFPEPRVGSSSRHALVAGIALVSLALWPALSGRRSPKTPDGVSGPATAGAATGRPVAWGLRPGVAIGATAVLLGLLGLFAAQLYGDGPRIGLTERLLAGAEALWPLVTVLSARRATRPLS